MFAVAARASTERVEASLVAGQRLRADGRHIRQSLRHRQRGCEPIAQMLLGLRSSAADASAITSPVMLK